MKFQRRRGKGTATVLLKNPPENKKSQTKIPLEPVEKLGARGLQASYLNSNSWRNMYYCKLFGPSNHLEDTNLFEQLIRAFQKQT